MGVAPGERAARRDARERLGGRRLPPDAVQATTHLNKEKDGFPRRGARKPVRERRRGRRPTLIRFSGGIVPGLSRSTDSCSCRAIYDAPLRRQLFGGLLGNLSSALRFARRRETQSRRDGYSRSLLHSLLETGRVLLHVLLPVLRVPQLEVVADTEQDDLVIQASQGYQAVRQKDAASLVHIDPLGLGEIEAAEDAGVGVGRGSLVEAVRLAFQALLREQPDRAFGARCRVEESRLSQLFADALRQHQAFLVVQRARMSPGQEHGSSLLHRVPLPPTFHHTYPRDLPERNQPISAARAFRGLQSPSIRRGRQGFSAT